MKSPTDKEQEKEEISLVKSESGQDTLVKAESACTVRYTIGVISLIFVVVGWVSTNFLTQEILKDYDKPFLMTYLNSVTFQLYFIFLLTGDPLKKYLPSQSATTTDAGEDVVELKPFTTWQTAKLGFAFFLLYFGSNYLTTIAFGATSAGSASILASTCGFFTLLFGRIVGVEKLTVLRVVAVLVSVGGVLVLGKSEFQEEGTAFLGNMLSLAGAAMYGVYSVFLKKVTRDESRVSMPVLFAFAGLYTMLFIWPILILLHYMGRETFALPPSGTIYMYLLINMFCGSFLPNYLWNVAFIFTSPLIVAIGISFNIPLTLLGDYLLYGRRIEGYKIGSAICVIVGFTIVNLASMYPQYDPKWKSLVQCRCRK